MELGYVNYGDYVMLLAEDSSGYLMSPGFVDKAVVVQEAENLSLTPNVRAMLFQVIPRLSYDALQHSNSSLADAEKKKRKEVENDLNEKTIQVRSGEPIVYGQELQFRHVKSQMMLRAADDKDNPRLELSEEGDDSCFFKVSVRSSAMQSEVRVAYGAPVFLLSSKIWKYVMPHSLVDQTHYSSFNLFASDDSDSAPVLREASLSKTIKKLWKCTAYCPFSVGSRFNGGDIVRIRHSKDSWFLANEGRDDRRVYGEKHQTLSSSLFILEIADSDLRGKPCTLKTNDEPSKFRLRHLLTGKIVIYSSDRSRLTLADGDEYEVEDSSQLTFELSSPSTEEYLRDKDAFKIKIQDRYLQASGDFNLAIYSSTGASTAKCYKLFMLEAATEDTFCIEAANAVRVKEIEMVMSTKPTLVSFVKTFINDQEPSQELFRRLEDVLTKLIQFITESEEQDPLMCTGTPNRIRQQYLRELEIIMLVNEILNTSFSTGFTDFNSLEQGHPLTRICQLAYFFINLSARGNVANQEYCAQWVPLYLEHCESGKDFIRTESTLAELADKNKPVQEQLGIPGIIARFINLCIDRGQHASYIRLVTSMYSCSRSDDIFDILLTPDKQTQLFMPMREEDAELQIYIADQNDWFRLADLEAYSARTDNGESYGYFLALLEMVSELAISRSPKAFALKSVYSLDICYACASNVSLSNDIRTRFVKVITQLHVPQSTLMKLELPNRTRYWKEVQQDADLTCSKLPLPPDVQKIQTFVLEFLETEGEFVADQAKNNLIKEVLLLVKFMVSHGFYKTTSDLSNILSPLIRLLKTNSLVKRANGTPLPSARKLGAVVPVNSQSPLYSDMASMQTICTIIKKVLEIKSDTQMTLFLNAFKSPFSAIRRQTDYFNIIAARTGQSPEVEAELRPALSWLSEILQEKQKDLLNVSANNLVAVMLSLVMQKDPELLKTVFKLILINFTQVSTLTKHLCYIELKNEAEDTMLEAKELLGELNYFVDRVDTWLGSSQDDFSNQRVPEILASLATICSKAGQEGELSDKELYEFIQMAETGEFTGYEPPIFASSYEPSPENQRMLLNMNAHHPIMVLIAYRSQDENYSRDLHHKILRHCYVFLAKLCHLEPSIQAELHMYLPYFADDVPTHVFAVGLIKEIFRNNSQLTENVSLELFKNVINVLKSSEMSAKKTSILHLFVTFLRCDGKIVRRNQSKVMDALSQGDKETVLKTYTSLDDQDILQREINSVISKPPTSDMITVSNVLSYFTALLDVLASTAEGKIDATEMICRNILPIWNLVQLLKVTGSFWPLKRRLLQFYQHVYLDVEKPVEGIEIVQVLEVMHDDLALILNNKRSFADLGVKYRLHDTTETMQEFAEDYAFWTVLPCITYILSAMSLSTFDQPIVELTDQAISLHRLADNPAYRETSSKLISVVKANAQILALLPVLSAEYVKTVKEEVVEEPKALINSGGDSDSKQTSLRNLVRRVKELTVVDLATDLEFEELVSSFINVKEITTSAFGYNYSLESTQVISALISINAPSTSPLDHKCIAMSVRILRRIIEMENKTTFKPAAEWGVATWAHCRNKVLLRQNFLADLDVVQLLCDLMVKWKEEDVRTEVVLCAIAMLLGGNSKVQGKFYNSLSADTDNQFMTILRDQVNEYFEEGRKLFNEIIRGAKFSEDNFKQVQKGTKFAADLLKLLQLLCEGHNADMQKAMKERRQDAMVNATFFVLIDIVGGMLGSYIPFLHKDNIPLGIQIIETLTEFVQGPCRENQSALIQLDIFARVNDLQTCLSNTAEHEIRGFKQDAEVPGKLNASSIEEIGKLSAATVVFLLALLDGDTDVDTLSRISTTLNFKLIKERMFQVFARFVEDVLKLNVAEVTLEKIRDRLQKDSFKGSIEEGFNLCILLNKIADHYPAARAHIKKPSFTKEEFFAYKFFKRNVGRIEVVVEGVLQRTYFPILPICIHISEASKEDVILSIDRSDPYNKIFGLVSKAPDLLTEMKINERLEQQSFHVTPEKVSKLRDMAMVLVLVINYLLIFYYDYEEGDDTTLDVPSAINTAVFALGVAQLGFSFLVLVGWSVLKAELVVIRGWRLKRLEAVDNELSDEEEGPENEASQRQELTNDTGSLEVKAPKLGDELIGMQGFTPFEVAGYSVLLLLRDNTFSYYTFIVFLSVLALFYPIVFSILLLDVIYRFPTLRNILASVVTNGNQLLLTAMLGLIILYIYAFWGFTVDTDMYFDDNISDYGENQCQSLWLCFLSTVNRGLRSGGGIYDVMDIVPYDKLAKYYQMFIFSLSFFIIINVILLNIVFGIIIDTFAELRDQRNAIEKDVKNKCLICNLDRNKFDHTSSGFHKHITEDHNVWQYLYFIAYLLSKDNTEYNGVESYCSAQVAAQEISWIPQNQALSLRSSEKAEENLADQISKLAEQVSKLQDQKWRRNTDKKLDDQDAKLMKVLSILEKATQ
jgi:hypothetical protein